MPRKPVEQLSIPGFGFIYRPSYTDRHGEKKYSTVWWMQYKLRPTDKQYTCRSTKMRDQREAFNELLKVAGRMATGEQRESSPDRVKINQLLDLMIEDYDTEGKHTLYDLKCRIDRHLRPSFGDMKAMDLTTSYLKQWKKLARAGKSPVKLAGGNDKARPLSLSTTHKCLANLRHALKLGSQHEPRLVLHVPHFPIKKDENARSGLVNREVYRLLCDELAPHAKLAFVMAYHTGMRRGEVLGLRWDQVDLKVGLLDLTADQTKNKTERTAPIYGDMRPYLEMAKAERDASYPDCPYIVQIEGSRIYEYKTAWHAAIARLKKRDALPKDAEIRVHDLRRTAATEMHNAGVRRERIMDIMGWKSSKMFERYRIGTKKAAIETGKVMEQHFADQDREEKEDRDSEQIN